MSRISPTELKPFVWIGPGSKGTVRPSVIKGGSEQLCVCHSRDSVARSKDMLGGSGIERTETAVPAFKIYYVEPGGLVPAGWSPVRVTLCVCESAHACVYPCGVAMWKTFETYLRVAGFPIG